MTNAEKYKTPEERANAFLKFCTPKTCAECKVDKHRISCTTACQFIWLDLEAEDEKPLPCPFCHKETMPIHINSDNCFAVKCYMGCGYTSAHTCTEHGAIHNHNELCRKVKGEGK